METAPGVATGRARWRFLGVASSTFHPSLCIHVQIMLALFPLQNGTPGNLEPRHLRRSLDLPERSIQHPRLYMLKIIDSCLCQKSISLWIFYCLVTFYHCGFSRYFQSSCGLRASVIVPMLPIYTSWENSKKSKHYKSYDNDDDYDGPTESRWSDMLSWAFSSSESKKLERSYWSWYSASMSNFTRKQTKSSFKGGGGQNWQKN